MTPRRSTKTVIERRRDQLYAKPSPTPHENQQWIEEASAGCWPDIDYADRSTASWSPLTALHRIRGLARAYRDPFHPNHGNEVLFETAIHALEYWLDENPESENWWYNEIGAPRAMRDILALLDGELRETTRTAALEIVDRTPVDGTGANLLWKAEIAFMHACFMDDESAAARISDRAAAEIEISAGEGIQPDFSFHQHGALLQQYHYGASFVQSAVSFAGLVQATPWEWSPATRTLLGHLVAEGHRWMQRGGIASPSTLDRAIARPGAMTISPDPYRQFVELKGDVDDTVAAFVAHLEAGVPATEPAVVGHKHFWRSDFTVHHTPVWSATLKTVSDATRNTESINGENLAGEHLTAGALFTLRAGDEYYELMPVWDWHAIPGTTTYSDRRKAPARQPFAGGISDGRRGIDVLDFVVPDGELAAKKAWFFTPDRITCLGAGITATDGPVHTAIEQCHHRSEVVVREDGRNRTVTDGTYDKPSWITHDGMRYRFLAPAAIAVSATTRSGDWSLITDAHAGACEEDVFSVVIDHGQCPDEQSYAYCIEDIDDAVPAVTVLANTTALQAVHDGYYLQLAVHEAGAYGVGDHTVRTDSPCLFQLGPDSFTVGEPSRRFRDIEVMIDDERFELEMPTDAAVPPQTTIDTFPD